METRNESLKALFTKAQTNRDEFWAGRGLVPFEMSDSEVVAYQEADLLTRAAAILLDVGCSAGLAGALWELARWSGWERGSLEGNHFFLTVIGLAVYAYYVWIPFYQHGTLGKRMFGLTVLSRREGGVTLTQLFVSEIVGKFLLGYLTYGLIFLFPIHDRLSGTQVKRVTRRFLR